MKSLPATDGPRRATVRRIRPPDAARMRALRLEMLADSPLAFLETLADAAARPHDEYAARVAACSTGWGTAQFVATPADHPAGPTPARRPDGPGHGGVPSGPGDRPLRLPERRRLVGHAGGTVLPGEPDVTVVFAVYVTPAWRGTGVLADLIEGVAAWSRECGRPELMLEVVVGNDRAVRAYRRLGFTDTGVRVPHPTIPALTEMQLRRTA
ncbi:GCN5 family acetyltransferase [Micromonospora rosaria]|uniref:GCN5 family acetyltransferase n=1 Tax=Micromonospora rosaria TaxID=47874 RepID=A0A136PV59_9ACTN|nr:GNAT family N-acetyltransferase [Micromonospora rosaria]KXK62243.1 GCN5 family acetyltransferase [Micromonospora rosaria]